MAKTQYPRKMDFVVDTVKAAAVVNLVERGGSPQECESGDNDTIVSSNRKSEEPDVVGNRPRSSVPNGGMASVRIIAVLAGGGGGYILFTGYGFSFMNRIDPRQYEQAARGAIYQTLIPMVRTLRLLSDIHIILLLGSVASRVMKHPCPRNQRSS